MVKLHIGIVQGEGGKMMVASQPEKVNATEHETALAAEINNGLTMIASTFAQKIAGSDFTIGHGKTVEEVVKSFAADKAEKAEKARRTSEPDINL